MRKIQGQLVKKWLAFLREINEIGGWDFVREN